MVTIRWTDVDGEFTVTIAATYEQTFVTHLIEQGAKIS